jgi:hypothetical protein
LVVSAGPVVQVGLVNQAVRAVSVVSENRAAQGALGNQVAPVAPVALEHVPVVAVPQDLARRRVPAGVAPTKWGIVAFPQVRVRAAEGLAAGAETQLARVATVVARVWAAAATAVAAAVTAVAAAAVAVAAAVVEVAAAVVAVAAAVVEVGDEQRRKNYEQKCENK